MSLILHSVLFCVRWGMFQHSLAAWFLSFSRSLFFHTPFITLKPVYSFLKTYITRSLSISHTRIHKIKKKESPALIIILSAPLLFIYTSYADFNKRLYLANTFNVKKEFNELNSRRDIGHEQQALHPLITNRLLSTNIKPFIDLLCLLFLPRLVFLLVTAIQTFCSLCAIIRC